MNNEMEILVRRDFEKMVRIECDMNVKPGRKK